MATDREFAAFVCDQMRGAGVIEARKMFGEYAVYCDGKVVALLCDDQLFVKPTPGGRALLGAVAEAPPYPGAKPHFLLDDALDDPEGLVALIRLTARELPAPKPKRSPAGEGASRKRAKTKKNAGKNPGRPRKNS